MTRYIKETDKPLSSHALLVCFDVNSCGEMRVGLLVHFVMQRIERSVMLATADSSQLNDMTDCSVLTTATSTRVTCA